ncbi:hypothetical protein B0H14DRAFT_2989662, partial [Mycena olivaceomarginata]
CRPPSPSCLHSTGRWHRTLPPSSLAISPRQTLLEWPGVRSLLLGVLCLILPHSHQSTLLSSAISPCAVFTQPSALADGTFACLFIHLACPRDCLVMHIPSVSLPGSPPVFPPNASTTTSTPLMSRYPRVLLVPSSASTSFSSSFPSKLPFTLSRPLSSLSLFLAPPCSRFRWSRFRFGPSCFCSLSGDVPRNYDEESSRADLKMNLHKYQSANAEVWRAKLDKLRTSRKYS